MSDFTSRARQVQDEYTRKVDKARARYKAGETGVAARDREIAKAFSQARRTLDHLQDADTQQRSTQRLKLERDLFGLGRGGGTSLNSLAWRDAQDRAAQIGDIKEAQRLLNRATRGGDESLARAIAAQAAELGWGDVLKAYFADKPKDAARYDEWAQLKRDENSIQAKFDRSSTYVLFSPSEISKLQPHQIEQLAASDKPADHAESA